MDLKLSDAEQNLRDDLRAWLDSDYTFAAHLARTATATSRDDARWRTMVDRGWIARALPNRDAIEQSTIDAAIIAEEFGRAVVVEPFFRSAFLVANLVFEAAEPALADNILARIGSGEGRFAAALYEPGGRFRPEVVTTRAEQAGEDWVLSGRKAVVMDGADADHLLVSARLADGTTGLFMVAGEAEGLVRTGYYTIDDAAAADLTLDRVAARAVAIGGGVGAAITAGIDRTITALGAEAAGAAQAALDETAGYAGKREQFGRPIAHFQVIAHRLARMFIELEALRGGVFEALANVAADAGERALAASALKVLVAEKARFVVNQGIQVHGGVGTVNDYKVSHCFKRVFALETLYGNGDYHLARYAREFD
ncbi:hypothetical protein DFR49_3039 [Hephaestia caeni]|uniref:Alkylation response protein AidB-like acyl-CoA dehydrogenase n=1 Tax=Hephaestia caeni TaxID=645617 RepID=A0A397NHZ8_9SPHN|nr:acyl-CoA dehydrogenase [Hephaestia caeni]RIA37162.1 hypothetical protein DFR49_3039 [Hephaestia caeni]